MLASVQALATPCAPAAIEALHALADARGRDDPIRRLDITAPVRAGRVLTLARERKETGLPSEDENDRRDVEHDQAADEHDDDGKRHDRAAQHWADTHDEQRSSLDQRDASIDRDAAEVDRDRGRLERDRGSE